MKLVIAADQDGLALKETIKQELLTKGYDLIDLSENKQIDFVEAAKLVAENILANNAERGIIIDGYGVGSYIACNKIKGIIAANVADEFSAKATRDHNSTQIICLGAKIVGEELAKNIVSFYLQSNYSAGRHQVRVDMLNKML